MELAVRKDQESSSVAAIIV